MTLGDLSQRLKSLQGQFSAFARIYLEDNSEVVLDLQKEQLFAGKASDGENIRPSYSEDLRSKGGFFKTPQAAQKYAEWKAGLSYPSNAQRDTDTPNLYVNGRFHSELGVAFSEEEMAIVGETDYAKRIIEKYGEDTFGLSRESMDKLKPELTQSIIEQIKQLING